MADSSEPEIQPKLELAVHQLLLDALDRNTAASERLAETIEELVKVLKT